MSPISVVACYADIAFVIDNSGSIRDNDLPGVNNWNLILEFVKSIIDLFTISPEVTRIAVVDFGWCYKAITLSVYHLRTVSIAHNVPRENVHPFIFWITARKFNRFLKVIFV